MKVELISIDKIIPYASNPRINDPAIPSVAASLKEFGWRQPIVVDSENVIIVGHTRYLASQKLGLKEVPVHIADNLTPAQIKAYRIADNKTGSKSEWDYDLLAVEFEQLDEMGFDTDLTGFDVDEINDITDTGPTEGLTDPDDVPEPPEEPVTKLGDMYQLGDHRLICGDSTDPAVVERLMGGKKADMVFTDPPYGIDVVANSPRLQENKSLGSIGGSVMARVGSYLPVANDNTTETAKDCLNLFFDTDKIVWGGNYFTDFLPPSRGWIVWDKRNGDTTFADCELAYTNFNKSVRLYGYLWSGMRREGDRKEEGVLRFHPTQKPVGLVVNILSDWFEGQNVIDPFLGSGSTLIACEKMGLSCYGIELEPHYCDVIVKRWEDFTGKKAVLLND